MILKFLIYRSNRLKVVEGVRSAHNLFTSVDTMGRLNWELRRLLAFLLSSFRVLRAFFRLSLSLATWRARRFTANASSSMRAVVALTMICFSSESSLWGSYFLAAFFAGAFGLTTTIGRSIKQSINWSIDLLYRSINFPIFWSFNLLIF